MRRRDWLRKTVAAGLGASAARILGAEAGALLPRLDVADVPAGPLPVPVPPDHAGPLVAKLTTAEVWPGYPTTLVTYDGVYPSPTIRARRGDVFDLLLENQLAEPTNVHWHGLAVPADSDGHPMDVVQPGGARRYTFEVHERPGTYWYHPHPDGRTAAQVYRGMAGFFIVEDVDEDRALGLPTGDEDVALLLQDRRLTADRSFLYAPTTMDLMPGYLGDLALVNGVPEARMTVAPALHRFRLLNGANARVFRVAFDDGRAFQVIAGDGGLLPRPVDARSLFLSPGERAEIVVDFSRDPSGHYLRLVSLGFPGSGGGSGGLPQGTPLALLDLTVQGTPRPATPLPGRLVPLEYFGPPTATRQFVMAMQMPPAPGNFTINGLAWDPNRIDLTVERGVVEQWTVLNTSAEPHPFHVHATQFHVLGRTSGRRAPHEMGRKDTVLVWPGETVQLAVRFEHHAGVYVLHCHNLEHEDAGMMSNFEVL